MNKLKICIRVYIRTIPIIAILAVLLVRPSDTTPYVKYLENLKENKITKVDTSPTNDKTVTFYALGDWGTGNNHQKMVALALKKDIQSLGTRATIPFILGLGDNIYNDGLPITDFQDPKVISMLHDKFGEIYKNIKYDNKAITFHVVPGNHDYYQSDDNNLWGGRIHEETTAEFIYDGSNDYPIFKSYPVHHDEIVDSNDANEQQNLQKKSLIDVAFPQIIDISHLDDILIVAIDTQLWLNLYSLNLDEQVSKYKEQLAKAISESNAKWKFIFGHHPIATNGTHSGFRCLREWTWSGTRDRIPYYMRFFTFLWGSSLSVIGDHTLSAVSPYKQDIFHESYRKYIFDIESIIKENPIDFIISGHDHCLQFIECKTTFQIVSGSAGKKNAVTHDKNTIFSHETAGYVKFDLNEKEVYVHFIGVDINNNTHQTNAIFRVKK